MIYSMTGYGSSQLLLEGVTYEVSIRSVNSKQLDLSLRLPSILRDREIELRGILIPALFRGKVDVTIRTADNSLGTSPQVQINAPLLRAYYDQIHSAIEAEGIPLPEDLTRLLLSYPGVIVEQGETPLTDEDMQLLSQAIGEALDQFNAFREQEGASLERIFVEKLDRIATLLAEVDPYEQSRITDLRSKLEERLAQLTSIQYDETRLEQELIYYIEKLDISEEKNRLANHIRYFREVLAQTGDPDPSRGKKLGFITQEMGREINTLGSKSNNAAMQQLVVQMKDELEQIKEQVLNIL